MGGKPWTSKGCIDCRRRKIKCDEKRPQCGRCLKSGIKCQGWEQHRNFVGAATISQARMQKRPAAQSSMVPIRDPGLPSVVAPAQAMRAQVFSSFIQRYFSNEHSLLSTSFDDYLMCSIGSLAQKTQMTDRALSAMACLFLGKTNSDTAIFNHGLYLYHSAIRRLSGMIQRGVYTNELLYTAVILQEIGTFYAPHGLSAWGTHVAGVNTLLTYYRARGESDPIIDRVYHHRQKVHVAFTSTGMNLTQAEYDYLMEPANGDPILEILHMTVAIGELKSTIDSINPDHLDLIACEEILQKCYDVHDKLINMCQDGSLGEQPTESLSTGSNDTSIPSPDHLFGRAYQFTSAESAINYTTAWAHVALLAPIIDRARSLVQRTHSKAAKYPALQPEDLEGVNLEEYADKVSRAMPYFVGKSMKLSLSKFAMLSLCIVTLTYVDSGSLEKHTWCREIVQYISNQGIDFASHIYTLTAYQWERRWGKGDPLTCISFRQSASPICNSNPVSISKLSKTEQTTAALG